MHAVKSIARLGLASFALAEGAAALVRFQERKCLFRAAATRAAATGRKLVVVGDPDGGFHTRFMRAYDCGDLCVDLAGCPACPMNLVADITKGQLPGIADDSVIVFVSCVFEYVEDLHAAMAEVRRIAGHPGNIFVVTVQPWTLTSRLYPGARWRGHVRDGTVEMHQVSSLEMFAAAALVGSLAAASCWPSRS
ncbi:hypothetical protein [Nannocystis pusilla]|uniref:Methyltransferase type 11 domain-containing protein n=1 Tax=Nannocystis pusilla TaxID=889268 RepID=A0ABS7TN61_9BACT|nr:hypothetical protein [Nannocystis pusilla]MBZ5709668.1 hypothetical protein [Nannocystis pusilla]